MDAAASPLAMRLERLLVEKSVVGASVALLRRDSIEVAFAGQKDNDTAQPVDSRTVFAAASLTKPIVSYAVLQLVDAGVLDLDEPLSRLTTSIVPDDAKSALITLRHVLTHTCGLRNLRDKNPPRMYFRPGSWFSYSSLGFTLLQSAVEARTGEGLEATLQRLVFGPLAMNASSLEWQDRFVDHAACGQPARSKGTPRHASPAGGQRILFAANHGRRLRCFCRGGAAWRAAQFVDVATMVDGERDGAEGRDRPPGR